MLAERVASKTYYRFRFIFVFFMPSFMRFVL